MNILYICPRDPRVANTGSTMRTAFLWKALKELGTVYTVIYPSKEVDLSRVEVREGLERDRIHVVPNNQTSWWNWLVVYVSRKLMKNGSLSFTPRGRMRRAIGWPDVKFDCVVARYIDQAANRVAWKLGPLYVDIDDLPTTVFDKINKFRLPSPLRPLAGVLVRIVQERVLLHARGLWVTNQEDLRLLQGRLQTRVLRNIAPNAGIGYAVDGRQEDLLLTVGSLGYGPNVQGIEWFLGNIWPEVRQAMPTLKYVIAGGGLDEATQGRWESVLGVHVLGFVDDLAGVYERARAVVTPVLSGAGTCVKTIEACKRGRKVFATDCAARGFDAVERSALQIEVFKGAEDFVARLCAWLELSESSRQARQKEILSASNRINSIDDFFRSVREVLDPIAKQG